MREVSLQRVYMRNEMLKEPLTSEELESVPISDSSPLELVPSGATTIVSLLSADRRVQPC